MKEKIEVLKKEIKNDIEEKKENYSIEKKYELLKKLLEVLEKSTA